MKVLINFKKISFQTLQQQLQSCEVLVMLVTHEYIKALQQSSSSNYREVGPSNVTETKSIDCCNGLIRT